MKHVVHVTNYQQYIDAGFLAESLTGLISDLAGEKIHEAMYLSIAYFTINKTHDIRSPYEVRLAVSIKGKTYTYKLASNQQYIYDAFCKLSANQYEGNNELKDAHIKIVQAEFERLVFMRDHKIVADMFKAYNIKTV